MNTIQKLDAVHTPSPLLTPQQVADYLAIPLTTVYEHARTGLLPSVRIGRSVRFKQETLDRFIESGGQAFEGGWRKEGS